MIRGKKEWDASAPKCDRKALDNHAKQSHDLERALDALEQIPPTPEGIDDEFDQLVSMQADRIERDAAAFDVASLDEAAKFASGGLDEQLSRVEMAKGRCLRWGEPYNWVPPTFAHPGKSLALKRIVAALARVDRRAAQILKPLVKMIENCPATPAADACGTALEKFEQKEKALEDLRQRIVRWLRM